jgi:hypothetical protein
MQETHPSSVSFFRSYEPAGFSFRNVNANAEVCGSLPNIDDAEKLAQAGWFAEAPTLSAFADLLDGTTTNPGTTVRVLASAAGLFIAARMAEPKPERMRRVIPADHPDGEMKINPNALAYSVWKDDHFTFAIDPTHNHKDYYEVMISSTGFTRAQKKNYEYHESVHPHCVTHEPAKIAFQHRALCHKDAWYAFAKLEWKSLGLDGAPALPVIGFNAVRLRAVDEIRFSAWARTPDAHKMAALDFGDLYIAPALAQITRFNFGQPVLDRNSLQLELRNAGGASISARVVVTGNQNKNSISDETTNVAAGAGEQKVSIGYKLSRLESKGHTLTVELIDRASGKVFHQSQFQIGRNSWVCAGDRYEWDAPQPNPAPGDENFVDKKRNYITSRLPRFDRVTTAQGAPSDFCLESVDGKVRFNLMQPDVCARIARFVESKFDTDNDRMAAASMLIHQRVFAMHCNELTSTHHNMSPESAMRNNGGHCFSRALSLAGVLSEMQYVGTNRKYHARICFVLGHVICAIVENDNVYYFDPTLGSFYYRHDNKAFATREEMAADLSICERWVLGRNNNFSHPQTHVLAPVGNVRWPAGAPIPER